MIVKCPHCQTALEWSSENIFKPFCSERCKLIDLGEWFLEEKRIPDVEIDVEDPLLQYRDE